jgi:SAM-dependent methyltransferase
MVDDDRRALHDENRLSWNAATVAHNSHKADQAAFFRRGGNKLFPEEMELLGDVRGKRIVHLQCNAGQDSLSLVQLGASVTGVDISDEAIDFARALSRNSGLAAEFHRADVFDWLERAAKGAERFDIVFCSYGAICWLSDLTSWAKGIYAILVPGGRFVTVEFHPTCTMFDEKDFSLKYPYASAGAPYTWDEGVGDYVGEAGPVLAPSGYLEGVKDFVNPHRVHEFFWGVSDVITALIDAGLVIETFKEHPYSNGAKLFENMRQIPGRRWAMPEGVPDIPIMYSLAARKPR